MRFRVAFLNNYSARSQKYVQAFFRNRRMIHANSPEEIAQENSGQMRRQVPNL